MTFQFTSQTLPFCYSMKSYIDVHRTAALHAKLIQTCKYFYAKNPIVVVDKVTYNEVFSKLEYKTEKVYIIPKKFPYKLWITEKLLIGPSEVLIWPLFLSLIYQYDNIKLVIQNQSILLLNLKLMANKRNDTIPCFAMIHSLVMDGDNLEMRIE